MKTVFSDNYSVLIIATNKVSYLQFAFNCAQSILLFNTIKIYIVTDLDYPVPAYLDNHVILIPALPHHPELGLEIKLHLDEYTQTEHTLFIDSDCLCFDNLDPIFEKCANQAVVCVGSVVPAADWCGETQAATIKKNWGLAQLVRFNCGLCYMKKSKLTAVIFDKVREIAVKYDQYGFHRNNKWVNEEGLMSIAMMLNKQTPMPDDGSTMTDLYTDSSPLLDILKRKRILKNPSPGKPRHRSWYPDSYSPIILHFGGNQLRSYIYQSQAILLRLDRTNLSERMKGLIANAVLNPISRTIQWIIGLARKLKIK